MSEIVDPLANTRTALALIQDAMAIHRGNHRIVATVAAGYAVLVTSAVIGSGEFAGSASFLCKALVVASIGLSILSMASSFWAEATCASVVLSCSAAIVFAELGHQSLSVDAVDRATKSYNESKPVVQLVLSMTLVGAALLAGLAALANYLLF